MSDVTTENLRMRQFLLGSLDEAAREELEQLVLTEEGTRDKLLMMEDDLIEEYLEGLLHHEEREDFVRQFLSIPHQRDKLRIAKSLRRFARDEANKETLPIEPRVVSEAKIASKPLKRRPRSAAEIDTLPIYPKILPAPEVLPFHRNPLVYVPVAAIIVAVIGVGAIWYARYRGSVRHETQRQAVERELAELNASPIQNLPADQISTLTIPPFSPRSVVASGSSDFKGPILELWLLPRTKQSETYNAVLQRVDSEDKFQIPNLKLHERANDKAVRLRIPTRLLTPGVYRVQLNSVTPVGTVTDVSEYSFEIQ